MRRIPLLGAAAALCLTFGAACGGEGERSEADIKEDLSASLQEGPEGLDEETADCYADVTIEEVGIEEIRDVDLTDDEPTGEMREAIAEAASIAATECDPSRSG